MTRVCSSCGKDKDVSGGKICEKGHFVCKSCAYDRRYCPICDKKLMHHQRKQISGFVLSGLMFPSRSHASAAI